mmetsp:Transcript_883/g.1232  ORF Transcript_883/g.1232 Transcript_883/m.1232 type:complete len:453 (-) Transcript_883:1035-2393(-)
MEEVENPLARQHLPGCQGRCGGACGRKLLRQAQTAGFGVSSGGFIGVSQQSNSFHQQQMNSMFMGQVRPLTPLNQRYQNIQVPNQPCSNYFTVQQPNVVAHWGGPLPANMMMPRPSFALPIQQQQLIHHGWPNAQVYIQGNTGLMVPTQNVTVTKKHSRQDIYPSTDGISPPRSKIRATMPSAERFPEGSTAQHFNLPVSAPQLPTVQPFKARGGASQQLLQPAVDQQEVQRRAKAKAEHISKVRRDAANVRWKRRDSMETTADEKIDEILASETTDDEKVDEILASNVSREDLARRLVSLKKELRSVRAANANIKTQLSALKRLAGYMKYCTRRAETKQQITIFDSSDKVRELTACDDNGDTSSAVDILTAFFCNEQVKDIMDAMIQLDPSDIPAGVGDEFNYVLQWLDLGASNKALTGAVKRQRSLFDEKDDSADTSWYAERKAQKSKCY